MTHITASAPGKLLLLGDHAVVYDHPCLVTAVNLRYQVMVALSDDDQITINTPHLGQPRTIAVADAGQNPPRATAFVEAVIADLYQKHNLNQGLRIETAGPVLSYGLGSSSAISVAMAAALNALFDLSLDKRGLFDAAYRAVMNVQGTGSGFDVAAAVYGGTLYFIRGGKVIEPLDVGPLPLVIGYSGKKVGTVNLVEGVAALRDRHVNILNAVFFTMHRLVEEAKDHLLAENWPALGELMNINQGLLDALGVNTPQLTNLIFSARKAGALGAKLSGAGGGDCMAALVTEANQNAVQQAITTAGGKIVDLPLGAPGVRLES